MQQKLQKSQIYFTIDNSNIQPGHAMTFQSFLITIKGTKSEIGNLCFAHSYAHTAHKQKKISETVAKSSHMGFSDIVNFLHG